MRTTVDLRLLSLLLDSWNKPVVYVDTEHIIRYMNRPAMRNYSKWGNVIGKSIFECHNQRSREIMERAFVRLTDGEKEVMIIDSEKHRVYMRGVKDEDGELVGYYERYDPPSHGQKGAGKNE